MKVSTIIVMMGIVMMVTVTLVNSKSSYKSSSKSSRKKYKDLTTIIPTIPASFVEEVITQPPSNLPVESVEIAPVALSLSDNREFSHLSVESVDTTPVSLTTLSNKLESSRLNRERPLIEDYIDRNDKIGREFVRELERNQYEVTLNVLNKAKPEIDFVLHDISELLGKNCRTYWRQGLTSVAPCPISQEELQQKILNLNEDILVGTRYRVESQMIITELQKEITKLHQSYREALRAADTSSLALQSETNLVSPITTTENQPPFLADSPLVPFQSFSTTIKDEEQIELEPEEKEQMTLRNIFDEIESKDVPEKTVRLNELIDKLKSQGTESSFQLIQLAGLIKNSKDKTLIVSELKNKFPQTVQNIIWESKSKIKIQLENDTFRIIAKDNETVIGLVQEGIDELTSQVISKGEEWKFIPVDDGTSFALYNIDMGVVMGCQVDSHLIRHQGKRSSREGIIFLETTMEKDISMFHPQFLWKIILFCHRTISEQDYKEKLISNGTMEESQHDVVQVEEPCPNESFIVSLISVKYPDLALDIDRNGKVFPGDSNYSARFSIY